MCNADSTAEAIAGRIRSRRLELGMSYQDLADRTGMSKSSLQRYETGGIANIPLHRLETIASALEVLPDWLMGWDDAANSAVSLPVGAEPVEMPRYRTIPILGRIAAGLPLYAEQNIDGYTMTDLNHGAEYFALRVSGDSMNAARIQEGDLLIVRRQDEVENGEIAIVMVGDEDATVKRFYATGDTVTLMPQSTNPKHQPQIYDLKKIKVKVLGKVVKVEFSV